MRDLGLVNHSEPIARLFTQGMVQKGGVAMSKSRGNVVGAIDMADKYGCDTARLYILFAAPPEKDLEWSEEAIEGASRFLNKVYRLIAKNADRLRYIQTDLTQKTDLTNATAKEKHLVRKVHQTLKRVTNDFEVRWHFNSSVALLMELVNEIHAQEPLDVDISPMILKRVLEGLLLMLAPMAPHISEELWQMLGHQQGLTCSKWPAYREELAREEQFEVIIQINGRLRGKMLVDDGLSEDETRERALKDPRISILIDGKQVTKTVVVPKKLVNIVLR
jgi:leucyl-tRNA synthetase